MNNPFESHTRQLIALLSALGLTGCDLSQNLNPPKNGESVQISVNVPDGFAPHDIKVIYRSKSCTNSGYSLANGKKIEKDGYQELTLEPTPSRKSNIHTVTVPLSGGGSCKWELSNIRFGLAYKSTLQFGINVTVGTSANIVVRYDEHQPPAGSTNEKPIEGDFIIRKDFYPWIHEQFIGGHEKSVSLAGQDGLRINFYAPNARKIHFEPTIHSEFIVSSTEDEQISTGPDPLFTYPDGSAQPEGLRWPNFEKLQRIRGAAEQQRH